MGQGAYGWSLACALLVACAGGEDGLSGAQMIEASGSAASTSSSTGGGTSWSTAPPGMEGPGGWVTPGGIVGFGCPEAWGGGNVALEAEGEALHLTTALFSYISCGDPSSGEEPHPGWLIIHLFDESVDFATAKAGGGTRLELSTYWHYYDDDNTGWFKKDYPKYTRLYAGGDLTYPDVLLDIQSWSGSWEVFHSEDPPVLHGTIESGDPLGPHGSFDAAYCGELVVWWCPD